MQEHELLTRLLYRDALMLVIDKPPGIPVHKGSGGGETLEQHFDALRFGLPRPPALAHRLDRDTSGCLVLGRHRKALHRLSKLFSGNAIVKTYWAIVIGQPPQPEGVIDLPLEKKNAAAHRWHMKTAAPGQGMEASTAYRLMGASEGHSWLELQPRTGRTHQLRVHCAALGMPILGDAIYGSPSPGVALHLHARSIEIPLYKNKPPIRVSAPIPAHMREHMMRCGYSEACDVQESANAPR